MRRTFADLLHAEMLINKDIVVLTADLGFGMWDKIQEDFSGRFYNCGSSEMLMIGAAIGLHYGGKIPLCYSITPFLLARPYELLRTYVNYQQIPIKLVGCGRDKEYAHDGISHWAEDAEDILCTLPNIGAFFPQDLKYLEKEFKNFLYSNKPEFISLSKHIYDSKK